MGEKVDPSSISLHQILSPPLSSSILLNFLGSATAKLLARPIGAAEALRLGNKCFLPLRRSTPFAGWHGCFSVCVRIGLSVKYLVEIEVN